LISIIIPSYNEEHAIASAIEKCRKVLTAAGMVPFEIIVVDDGSTDQTSAIAITAGATVKTHLQNKGYGFALKTGINAAQYDTVVIIDGDSTYPVETIPALHRLYATGYNMVVGAREGKFYSGSLMKSGLRLFLKWLVQYVTGTRIPDINSGLRVFSRKEVIPFFPSLSNAFSFTTSVTLVYLLTGKFIKYVPISYHKRTGNTKVRLGRDILRTLQYITEIILYYNPIKIYLLLAAVCLVLGLIMTILATLFGNIIQTGLAIAFLGFVPVIICASFMAIQARQSEKLRNE
jgi:glycosyltransferase involved in cell wall biosynthesis